MRRPETEGGPMDIQKADELLKRSLGTMADITRVIGVRRNIRLNEQPILTLSESSSDGQILISKLRLITFENGRIVKREDFTTQQTPYSTKFSHEFTTWDASEEIKGQKRVLLWLDGPQITIFRNMEEVEESVRRLSEVRDEVARPTRQKPITQTSY